MPLRCRRRPSARRLPSPNPCRARARPRALGSTYHAGASLIQRGGRSPHTKNWRRRVVARLLIAFGR
eukprot:11170875-Lingulodinium_polyedra.AAC.1